MSCIIHPRSVRTFIMSGRRTGLLTILGTQLLLDLKDCNPERLDDLCYIRQIMMQAANESGATIVGKNFHKFSPFGVTGIISIAESHLCIHTWPEHAYAAVDIFSCGANFKLRDAATSIINNLECSNPTITEIHRGLSPKLNSLTV